MREKEAPDLMTTFSLTQQLVYQQPPVSQIHTNHDISNTIAMKKKAPLPTTFYCWPSQDMPTPPQQFICSPGPHPCPCP